VEPGGELAAYVIRERQGVDAVGLALAAEVDGALPAPAILEAALQLAAAAVPAAEGDAGGQEVLACRSAAASDLLAGAAPVDDRALAAEQGAEAPPCFLVQDRFPVPAAYELAAVDPQTGNGPRGEHGAHVVRSEERRRGDGQR